MVQAAEAEKSCVSRRTRARCGLSWSPSPETAVPCVWYCDDHLGSVDGYQRCYVLLVDVDGQNRVLHKELRVYVLSWWRVVAYWYHSSNLVHGQVWSSCVGYNLVGFFVGLVLVGVGYSIDIETNLAAAEGVYLTGLILYMGFFGSYACLTWVVPAESFSLGTRSQGMTICSALLYLWAFTVTYNFNRMKVAMTYTGLTIGFYGGIAFLGFFYQVLFMPETKGRLWKRLTRYSRSHPDSSSRRIFRG